MLQLIDIVEKGEFEWNALLKKYRAMTEAFQYELHSYLRVSVELYLLTSVLGLWTDLFDITDIKLWILITANIGALFNFFGYPIFAALITDTFEKFDQLLWRYCMDHMEEECFEKNLCMNYVMRYPFVVTVGNLRISRKNLIKFVIIFSMTKLVAYLVNVVVGY